VNAEKSDVEAILDEINDKTDKANKAQADASTKKKQLDIDNKEIAEKQLEAKAMHEQSIPILIEA